MAHTHLTPKQENFCQYYLDTGNASEAYRMSYDTSNMKSDTVNRSAFELLRNHKIAARIEDIRAERAAATADRRKVVENVLMDIVTSDPNDLYITDPASGKVKLKSPSQLPKRTRNALKKIQNDKGKVSYEFNGKVEAARLLGSWNGWDAAQRVEVDHKGGMMGEIRIGFDDEE